MLPLTSYTAEQAQGGGVPSEAIEDGVRVALGNGNGHGDGFVELASARLQGDDGTEGGLVPQSLPRYVHVHWLGLGETRRVNGGQKFSDPHDLHSCRYLQSDPDPLGEGPFREHRLHLGDHGAAQDAAFRTNQIAVLLDARHHSKVLREISRDDPANALPLQLLRGVQV